MGTGESKHALEGVRWNMTQPPETALVEFGEDVNSVVIRCPVKSASGKAAQVRLRCKNGTVPIKRIFEEVHTVYSNPKRRGKDRHKVKFGGLSFDNELKGVAYYDLQVS